MADETLAASPKARSEWSDSSAHISIGITSAAIQKRFPFIFCRVKRNDRSSSSILVFIRISSILLVIIPQNLRKHAGKWLTLTYLLKFHSFFAGISIKTRFELGTWCWLFAASWPVSSSSAAPLCVSPSGSVIRCFGTEGSGHTLTTRPKWSYFSIDSALFFLYKFLQADKVQWYQVNDEKNSASSV